MCTVSEKLCFQQFCPLLILVFSFLADMNISRKTSSGLLICHIDVIVRNLRIGQVEFCSENVSIKLKGEKCSGMLWSKSNFTESRLISRKFSHKASAKSLSRSQFYFSESLEHALLHMDRYCIPANFPNLKTRFGQWLKIDRPQFSSHCSEL